MPNVTFVRPEVARLLPQYYLIRDAIAGEVTVKESGLKYLPMPNPEDMTTANKKRYRQYLFRAVFYNVSRRTLSGLVGQVFMRDPVVKLPTAMEVIEDDASGSGVSLEQQAKKSLTMTLAYSRSGLLVDYPEAPAEGVSKADIAEGNIRPVILTFAPQEVINWRVVSRGSREVLALVVIAEIYCIEDDGFEMKHGGQFRVLSLDPEGQYQVDIWREPVPTSTDGQNILKGNFQIHETYFPTDASGARLTEIPFTFIGSENNDSNPDHPNFYDLASINMAHYRNSADYEESCFIVGQPTPVITGLTEEWVKDVLKNKIEFGSRAAIALPAGGDAKLIQAEPNTMIKEAMETKERQMVALGAKLIEQKAVQRTAFETKVEATSEGSILTSVTNNVQEAYEFALKWCAQYMGEDDSSIEFELNTDFDIARLTPEEQNQAVKNWQSGAITFGEMRTVLRKAGQATVDDKEAQTEIAADQVKEMAMAGAAAQAAGSNPQLPQDNGGGK